MTRGEEPQKSDSIGRVLLYVRTEEDVSIIRNILRGLAAEDVVCTDVQDLCRRLVEENVNAVLLAESALAEGALRILAQTLQDQPRWSDVPVLFVTGGGLESPLAVQVMRELPNVLVLNKPIRIAALTSALEMALRMRDKQRQVRDLLEERRQREEMLEAANEQLSTEREELQRQSQELHRLKEQAERTARAMESLARLVEENPDPALRVSADGRIQYNNPAAFSLGSEWNGAGGQRLPPTVQEIVSAAYARTEVVRREMIFGERTYLVTAAPAPALTRYVNLYVRDITERTRAEEALRQSRDMLQAVVDTAPAGVMVADSAGNILLTSTTAQRLLGGRITGDAHGPQGSYTVSYPDGAPIGQGQLPLSRALAGESIGGVELLITRADGTRAVILADATPLQTDAGRLWGAVVVFQDITERKRAEEALRELTTTLESKVAQRTAELKHRTGQLQKLTLEMSEAEDRERERLAHILHDDLQQELAAAKFQLSLVRNRIQHDAGVQEMTATINEILKDAIAKSRSLSHELSPAVLHQEDFTSIVQWLAHEMQEKHGLAVHVQGGAHSASDGLRALLYRTAQELLFNVVKHAQVKEARVRVRAYGGYLGLLVSDHGRGFDPRRLREAAGFGLLSIRERVELIGGRMKIRSAPGEGSTFFVIVPNSEEVVSSQTSVAGEEKTPADRRLPTTGYRPPLRVLLADDHQVVRQGLVSLFSEEETIAVVGEATNGREAVDLARRLRPDVVVMDVLMPVMSGEEATRRIKQDLPETRIVSLSMREEPDVRERMCDAGAESYVLKTAPYKELLAAIRGDCPREEAGVDTCPLPAIETRKDEIVDPCMAVGGCPRTRRPLRC